ncbi:MAG: hypothetical protein ARM1_0313 [Candidatus Micrarchaeota archaeon]|nr:MAG: hypothetical protein ARM1_0313 [Candidatus Micrarchaeota archaeon]
MNYLLFIFYLLYRAGLIRYRHKSVIIDNREYNLEIADTTLKRALGLMYRKDIEDNSGLLIDFKHEADIEIWNYNMRFAIDLIYLNSNFEITKIYINMPSCKSIFKTLKVRGYGRYVIEIKHKKENVNIKNIKIL